MNKTASEIANLWDRALAMVKKNVDANIYESFFASSYIHSIDGDVMNVVVNSALAQNLLSTKYNDLMSSIVKELTESEFRLKFVPSENISKMKKTEETKRTFFKDVYINSNYTFDTFVVGPSNQEASQAALMIASNPGRMYNPLFIYSDSGLGKTHLLHSIGNFIKKNTPNARILYVTGDNFVDEFVRAVRGESDDSDIKGFIKSFDVLLFDDVQFLANKKETQAMLFSCYNALINKGKQIVITSDKHPYELQGLEDRLVTRFVGGLTVNITKPDTNTCLSILKNKIRASGMNLEDFDEDALLYFANQYSNNIRELEGALNSLLYHIVNEKKSCRVSFDVAVESTRSSNRAIASGEKLTEAKIITVVADYYNLTPSQITGKIRISQISLARHISMYLIRTLMDIPFAKIGLLFGGAHHTTVMNAVEKVDYSVKHDTATREAINELAKRLKP